MSFLKRVLSTVVGLFVFLFIVFFFFFIVAMLFGLGSSSDKKTNVKNNSVLNVNLDFPVKDNTGKVKYKDFSFLDEDKRNGLFHLTNAIEYAANDDKIKGITITSPKSKAGITQLKNLRQAIEKFKESGKFVTAYSDLYSQTDYYLSAVADTVYMSPVGNVDFRGLSTELLYMKDLQEKSGVKMDVVRVGKYKSAVEPFLENEISEANEKQVLSYLNSIWENLRKEIGENRNLSLEELDTIADQLKARTPEKALDVGLIDKIAYWDEYTSSLKNQLGIKEDDDVKSINLLDYAEDIGAQKKYKRNKNKIAVIYAQGNIVDEDGDVNKIAPDQINEAIVKARKNKNTKAVVLRVNSPGGSAMASDLIWRELEKTKKEKPVIVSMGDVAASGGYYISANADKIFAENSTITGSIGVFGMLPNAKELAEKVGVHAQHVKTNENAIAYSIFEGLTDTQEEFIQESIIETYDLFKTRVSEGRNLSMDEVEEIAQGRVWTGTQALENGLVDELGGLEDALTYAADQAEVEDYQIKEYPIFKIDLTKMLRKYGFGISKTEIIEEVLGEDLYPKYEEIKRKTETKGVQLLFPYSTEIK